MENMEDKNSPTELPRYIKAFGISYAGTLPKIKKSDNPLQPVFEAITNALEAIQMSSNKGKGEIVIKVNLLRSAFSTEEKYFDFDSVQVEDNGIGFNEEEFERLENLNDTRKGFLNKGSGRVQYLHAFGKTEVVSTFQDASSTTGYKERVFTLSKGDAFLKQNAIIHYLSLKDTSASDSKTVVTFKNPLYKKDSDFYKDLHLEELKSSIIDRYLATFCENREHLPQIKLQKNVNQETVEEKQIESGDIPLIDQQKDIIVHYSKLSADGRT
ncbi:MAG: ATP-binding protein, partial [Azospira oryzae]